MFWATRLSLSGFVSSVVYLGYSLLIALGVGVLGGKSCSPYLFKLTKVLIRVLQARLASSAAQSSYDASIDLSKSIEQAPKVLRN